MWTTIHARYSEMRCEVPIMVAEGDKVAANIRVFFRKRSNKRMVQFDIAAFYTFRERPHRPDPRNHRHVRLVQQVLERDVAADPEGRRSRNEPVCPAVRLISRRR